MRRLLTFVGLAVVLVVLSLHASGNAAASDRSRDALIASNLKAKEALELLTRGSRDEAVVAALQGLPESFTDQDVERFSAAYQALYRSFRSWNVQLPLPKEDFYHASFSPDGSRVVTRSLYGLIARPNKGPGLQLWDRRKRSLIAGLLSAEESAAASMGVQPSSFSADGKYFANLNTKKLRIIVWRSEDGKIHRTLPRLPNQYAREPIISPHPVILSATGRYVATTWEAAWKADGPQETILLGCMVTA